MCGLVYSQSFDGTPVNNDVLQQFDLQRHRGTEGFGIYDGQYLNMVHATKEDKILKWLVKYDSNILLMHHRYPTSTENVKKAAHPFSTRQHFDKHEYILAHNGVIKNAYKQFEEHQERGIEYQSLLDTWKFNDSEALLWDFALFMEGHTESMQSIGDIAFIALRKTDGVLTDMFYYRNNGRPLHMSWTTKRMELSSEGYGDMVPANTLHTWDYQTEEFQTSSLILPESVITYSPSTFRDNRATRNYGNSFEVPRDWDDDEIPFATTQEATRLKKIIEARYPELYSATTEGEDMEEEMEVIAGPSRSDAEITAMDYIATYKGHFEQAYWAVELDYDAICEEVAYRPSVARIKYKRLLEAVMEYITTDPEYENEESISSLWKHMYTENKIKNDPQLLLA